MEMKMGILFLALLVIVGWLVYRYVSQGKLDLLRSDGGGLGCSPEDILKRRLAEGKIDEKEYRRIRRSLSS
jgi:uncharacterized membrane protein